VDLDLQNILLWSLSTVNSAMDLLVLLQIDATKDISVSDAVVEE
jgi:hypothetical protein